MTTKVLIAEDDPGNRILLERFLASRGFETTSVGEGPAVLSAARAGDFDLIVLDLEMPGLDGIAVLERLRQDSSVPIVVLTGRVEEEQRLIGFAAGADDYVCKPYSLPELEARVRAVLRRGHSAQPLEPIEVGDIVVDLAAATVRLDGKPVTLTNKEFQLLAFFAQHPGHSFSRKELLLHVWGSTDEWQDPATVTEHIRRLRAKLERDRNHPTVIETVRGFGYRFMPDAAAEIA